MIILSFFWHFLSCFCHFTGVWICHFFFFVFCHLANPIDLVSHYFVIAFVISVWGLITTIP